MLLKKDILGSLFPIELQTDNKDLIEVIKEDFCNVGTWDEIIYEAQKRGKEGWYSFEYTTYKDYETGIEEIDGAIMSFLGP